MLKILSVKINALGKRTTSVQIKYMGLNKFYGTNRNKSMLAVFIVTK